MRAAPLALPFGLSPQSFWLWGRAALWGLLGLGLCLTVYLAWTAPVLVPAVPLLVVAGGVLRMLAKRPLLHLSVVLALFAPMAGHEEGLTAGEVLYGLYYLSFLGAWFGLRLLRRERLVHTAIDKALLLFLIGVACSPAMTLLYGGDLRAMLNQGAAVAMLAFYFPIKDACLRYRHGLAAMVAVLAWIGLYISLRNLIEYRSDAGTAVHLYQVMNNRVYTNDGLLMVLSVMSLTFAVSLQRWRERLLGLGCFLLFFGALVLTLSRSFWVSFAFGAGLLFLWADGRTKRQMLLIGAGGATLVLGLGLFFYSDMVVLVLQGLAERVSSLGGAFTDISLQGRFYEWRALSARIAQNPVLGHGMGVSYSWFNVLLHATSSTAFTHNGYLSLWYQFGLWGLAAMLFAWVGAILGGVRAYRRAAAPLLARTAGLGAAVSLTAYSLGAHTANPFHLSDGLFTFAMLLGLAVGASLCTGRTATAAPQDAPGQE